MEVETPTAGFDILAQTRDAPTAVKGLKLLRKSLKDESLRDDLLARLWGSEEHAWGMLARLWDLQSVMREPESSILVLSVSGDVVRACADLPSFQERGKILAFQLLNHGLKAIYSHLSSGENGKILAALGLLEALPGAGLAVLEELVRVFDFSISSLQNIARPKGLFPTRLNKMDKNKDKTRKIMKTIVTPRIAFLMWALAMLKGATPLILEQLLTAPVIGGSLLPCLEGDPSEWQLKVLKFIRRRVMVAGMPHGIQASVLHEGSLMSLARLVESAETSDEDEFVAAGRLAAEMLLAAVSLPQHGIAVPEAIVTGRGLIPRLVASLGRQRPLLRVLTMHLNPHTSETHRQVLIAAARHDPRLAAAVLSSARWTMDPQPTPRWLARAALVAELQDALCEALKKIAGSSQKTGIAAADLARLGSTMVVPGITPRSVISKGLHQPNRLVRLATLAIVHGALCTLQALTSKIDGPSAELLRRHIAVALPDVPSVLSCLTGTDGKVNASQEDLNEELEANLSLDDPVHDLVIKCLAAWARILPASFNEARMDIGRLLPKGFEEVQQLSLTRQHALLGLVAAKTESTAKLQEVVHDAVCLRALTPNSKDVRSALPLQPAHLAFALRVLTGNGASEVTMEARALALRLLLPTGLFDACPAEADIWLGLLASLGCKEDNQQSNTPPTSSSSVCAFFIDAIGAALRRPEAYFDSLTKAGASHSSFSIVIPAILSAAARVAGSAKIPASDRQAMADFAVAGVVLAWRLTICIGGCSCQIALTRLIAKVLEGLAEKQDNESCSSLEALRGIAVSTMAAGTLQFFELDNQLETLLRTLLLPEIDKRDARTTAFFPQLAAHPMANLLALQPSSIKALAAADIISSMRSTLCLASRAPAPICEAMLELSLRSTLHLCFCWAGHQSSSHQILRLLGSALALLLQFYSSAFGSTETSSSSITLLESVININGLLDAPPTKLPGEAKLRGLLVLSGALLHAVEMEPTLQLSKKHNLGHAMVDKLVGVLLDRLLEDSIETRHGLENETFTAVAGLLSLNRDAAIARRMIARLHKDASNLDADIVWKVLVSQHWLYNEMSNGGIQHSSLAEETMRLLGQLGWAVVRHSTAKSTNLSSPQPMNDRFASWNFGFMSTGDACTRHNWAVHCLTVAAAALPTNSGPEAWVAVLRGCLSVVPMDDRRTDQAASSALLSLRSAAAQAIVQRAPTNEILMGMMEVLMSELEAAQNGPDLARLLGPTHEALRGAETALASAPDAALEKSRRSLAKRVAKQFLGTAGFDLASGPREIAHGLGDDLLSSAVPCLQVALRAYPEVKSKHVRQFIRKLMDKAKETVPLFLVEVAVVFCCTPHKEEVAANVLSCTLELFARCLRELYSKQAGVSPTEMTLLRLLDTYPSELVALLEHHDRQTEAFPGIVSSVASLGALILDHRFDHEYSLLVLRRLAAGLLPDEDDYGIDLEQQDPADLPSKRSTKSDISQGQTKRARTSPSIAASATEEVAGFARSLLSKLLMLPKFMEVLQEPGTGQLAPWLSNLPRPLTSIVQLAEMGIEELEPFGCSKSPASSLLVKKELCELAETLLDILVEYTQSPSEVFDGTDLRRQLQRLLPLLMAGYGATLSPVDRAVWSLARTINGLLAKTEEASGEDEDADSNDLRSLLEGPLATDIGLTWGVEAVSAVVKAGGWASVTEEAYEQILDLDPLRCALTAAHFPEWRRLLEDTQPAVPRSVSIATDGNKEHGKELREVEIGGRTTACFLLEHIPNKNNHQEEKQSDTSSSLDLPFAEGGYDPGFILPATLIALRSGKLKARRAASTGLLALALRALAAEDGPLRCAAYEILAIVAKALPFEEGFHSRNQIVAAISAVREAVTEPFQRLSAVHALFLAESITVAFVPGNPLFGPLCKEVLSSQALNLTRIPLARIVMLSGYPNTAPTRFWLLRLLLCALRGRKDARLLSSRRVLELLMTLVDTEGLEAAERRAALRTLCRACAVSPATSSLAHQGALIPWLFDRMACQAIASTRQLVPLSELQRAVDCILAQPAMARTRRSSRRAPLDDLLDCLRAMHSRILAHPRGRKEEEGDGTSHPDEHAENKDMEPILGWIARVESKAQSALERAAEARDQALAEEGVATVP